MRLAIVENTSENVVSVKLSDGTFVPLQPGSMLEDVRVLNCGEIRDRTRLVYDLDEVR